MRYFPEKPPDLFTPSAFERRLRLVVVIVSLVLLAVAGFFVWMYR